MLQEKGRRGEGEKGRDPDVDIHAGSDRQSVILFNGSHTLRKRALKGFFREGKKYQMSGDTPQS